MRKMTAGNIEIVLTPNFLNEVFLIFSQETVN